MEEYRDAHLKHNPEYPQVRLHPQNLSLWMVNILL